MRVMTRCACCALAVQLSLAALPSAVSARHSATFHPLEPSDTSSPAATLNSLIASCNELHRLIGEGGLTEALAAKILPPTERILDCLDLSELPKELRNTAGIESALFLKEVLDRIALPADEDIPKLSDSGSSEGEALARWRIPHTRIAIARVEHGPRQHNDNYLFSAETVRRGAEYYAMVKGLPYRTGSRTVSPGLYDAYVAATKRTPAQTADTSSPRGTMTLFLDSCNELYEVILKERYFDRNNPEYHRLGQQIISCLDTSQLPQFSREYFDAEAAVCLKEVLDRIPLPPAEEIPGVETVEAADGTEPLVRWQVPRTQIVISKMQEGPHRGEFLFAAETVARAPEFYERTRSQPYRTHGRPVSEGFYQWWLSSPGDPTIAAWVDRLPEWFHSRKWGMAIWQWLGLIPSILVSLGLVFVVSRLGRALGQRVRERSLLPYWFSLGFLIVAVLIPLGFKHFVWEALTVRGTALYVVSFCADVVFLLCVLGLIIGGSSRIAESLIVLRSGSHRGLDANLIRIICRVLGIVIAVAVFLEGGRYLGFPLTTLIASAGIGGLAVALSAQGLIKGLFGTVTILLDKPYRVGERIVAKGHDGVVEEIGLRSTKIRALSDHLISIPNDQMADAEIENIGERKHIRRMTDLHIPLDTPRDKVQDAISCIRTILKDQEGLDPELPPRVYFTEFNPDSFNIRMAYWFTPPDPWQYYAMCEKVNLEIFREFEERGIQFSLPLRHTYWKHDDEQGPLEVALSNDRQHPNA